MNDANEERRTRARLALAALPSAYEQGEEGIAEAIGDLAHLAAERGLDAAALLARCRRNFETESAADPRSRRRYALLVVVEAASAEAAWEAVRGTAGCLQGDGEPDCVHIGGPWVGVPADAEDIGTESVRVAFSLPGDEGGYETQVRELRPCE